MKNYIYRFITAMAIILGTGFSTPTVHAQRALTAQDNVGLNKDLTRKTVVYAIKDTSELKMDIISKPDIKDSSTCVIFMFGGGFAIGRRDNEQYNRFFNRLAEEGFVVATIDYRLGLKGVKNVSRKNPGPLDKAVKMAVADLYSATSYLIRNAGEYRINPDKIIISGSSAGAISAICADWNKRNNTDQDTILPKAFQYAGVVSFAGALVSLNGKPRYATPPAPTMMFHGTQDSLVLYNGISFGKKMFLGSNKLAAQFEKHHYPYYIMRYEGMGHEIAGIPMRDNLDQVVWFIRNYVEKKQPYKVDIKFSDPNRERTFFTSYSNRH